MVGLPRPQFPSAPSEPSLRRLGVSGSSGGDRPVKAQLIVALVALIILLAVPLYLWRRPSFHSGASDAGISAPVSASSVPALVASIAPAVPLQPTRVRTNPIQRVRCGSSRTRTSLGVTCDALPAIEHAFVEAVQQSLDCAPKAAKEGTINHVLEVDFGRKTLHVFPGKSGDWHGPSARRTTKCVEHVLGKPDFSAIPHAHAYYALAVMATYPSAGAAGQVSADIRPMPMSPTQPVLGAPAASGTPGASAPPPAAPASVPQ